MDRYRTQAMSNRRRASEPTIAATIPTDLSHASTGHPATPILTGRRVALVQAGGIHRHTARRIVGGLGSGAVSSTDRRPVVSARPVSRPHGPACQLGNR
jgi:hypothetical protein